MRTEKSILNVSSNLLILIMKTIMLFIVRIIFIRKLGDIYLGIDSLFTNILSVFSIVELGINSAINFSLYKPLANGDNEKITKLMVFYKKLYNTCGFIVFFLGIFLSLFLNRIVNYNVPNLYFIYFLYLFNTVSTYFISYKETLIIADQNNYKLTKINFMFYMLLYLLRIIFLITTNSFIIYVMVLVVITLIQRIVINRYITKTYNYIDFNSNNSIDSNEKKNIFDNIKSMFMHKVGSYIINGTDNIIISSSKTLGIVYVGLYTNYLSIVSMVNTIFSGVFKGITSSFGNLAVLEKEDTQKNVFEYINFAGFLMYGLFSIGFYFLLSDFISICFGSKYQLDNLVVLVICVNFYLNGMISSIDLIKDATGVYKIDRFAPIVQAIINLIISVVLVNKIGLIGVVIGTLISIILVPLWNKPYIAYKYIFKSSIKEYIINQFKYVFSIIIISILLSFIFKFIILDNLILMFIVKGVIIIIVYLLILSILFYKNNNYKFYKNLIIKTIRRWYK